MTVIVGLTLVAIAGFAVRQIASGISQSRWRCEGCGAGIRAHTVAPDDQGRTQAWCR